MSERSPDIIDRELLDCIRALGLFAIDKSESFEKSGSPQKADKYRRIGTMLDGVGLGHRDPLLVKLWNYTSTGNTRVMSSSELNRMEAAVTAVYLLMKHDGKNPSAASKIVSKATGEKSETLRARFKRHTLTTYEASPAGAHTKWVLENIVRLGFRGRRPDWREVYDLVIKCTDVLSDEMRRLSLRIRNGG